MAKSITPREMIEAEGLVIVAFRKKRHSVFRCTLPGGGDVRSLTVSRSPSDHRALLNFRRTIIAIKRDLLAAQGGPK